MRDFRTHAEIPTMKTSLLCWLGFFALNILRFAPLLSILFTEFLTTQEHKTED